MLENQRERRISAQEKQVQEIDEKTSTVKNLFSQKNVEKKMEREFIPRRFCNKKPGNSKLEINKLFEALEEEGASNGTQNRTLIMPAGLPFCQYLLSTSFDSPFFETSKKGNEANFWDRLHDGKKRSMCALQNSSVPVYSKMHFRGARKNEFSHDTRSVKAKIFELNKYFKDSLISTKVAWRFLGRS